MPYAWLLMAGRTSRIEIRVTEEERGLEHAAASQQGETLSEFVRRAARREAERVLAERTRYAVDDDAAERFLDGLERPPASMERGLRGLVDKPNVLAGE